MKSIKAVDNFSLNGVYYENGDIVEVKNVEEIVRLNEKGFIEPLTIKEIQDIQKEMNKPKKIFKKEEE